MVSKNQIKRITALHQKKFRQQEKQFIAEGEKLVLELLNAGFTLVQLFAADPVFSAIDVPQKQWAGAEELRKLSALQTAPNCLAVFEMPVTPTFVADGLIVALDSVRDPGNLGTIIRLCDWFGVSQLLCSADCVDVYNPKVVQATMGSLSRVAVHYVDLPKVLADVDLPVLGTFMQGENVYSTVLPSRGVLVLGNEANGISDNIAGLVTKKLSIPRFGALQKAESLNVATATAILLSEFRRGRV